MALKGYGGKLSEQARARDLRGEGWTLAAIAAELGVARSSVSRWVRDVPFTPGPRVSARQRAPNALARARAAEVEHYRRDGRTRLGDLSERELLVAGLALYAGEGAKADGLVSFANSDPDIVRLFCRWFRTFFTPIENRLRVRLYLHTDCDLEAANNFWSALTSIPVSQFSKPYRAASNASLRQRRHPYGCAHVRYSCSRTHREVMGLIEALLTCASVIPG
jgi:transcriptional regulator with XRE-family HTH domain